MTNEEAIEIIEVARAEVEWEYPMDYAAAFDKAIEALNQEPCEDVISRRAVIDVIKRWLECSDYNEAERHIMRAIQSVLYDSPSVKSQEPKTGHWIPVSERIPEPNRLVLCYITTGTTETYFLALWNYIQDAWEEGIGGCRLLERDLGYEVIAWMSLPEPYEAESVEIKESDILEVTLLSIEEAEKLSREVLKAERSWWLRSPGIDDDKAAFVSGDYGDVYDYGFYVEGEFGVRPALKLKSSHLKSGDSFSYKGYKWNMISDDMALCKTIVGKCAFREDWEADNANNYNSSDIKEWLNDWWEKVRDKE